MNAVLSVWRALVQRRLLPVAILLIAAFVAVPVVLAEDAEPVAPPAPAKDKAASAADPLGDPVVSLVTDGDHKERRRVLGASKNPFEPGPAPEPSATPKPPSAGRPPVSSAAETPKPDTGSGGVPSGPSLTPPAAAEPPVANAPEPPERKYELYSLTVRFGSTESDDLPKSNLPRLTALPSAEDPVLVYLGLKGDGKTAVFLVDAAAEPQGDGTCQPSGAVCETIEMRAGDTEFFDVRDETGNVRYQYQLDLLDIKRSTTASAAKAKAARAKVSKAGRRALRTRGGARAPLRWRYDHRSGTVRKLSKRAYRAASARMARAAMASAGAF